MQHKRQFLDRPQEREPSHISSVFPELIRKLAEQNDITEDEAIARLRGKVVLPDEE